MTLSWRSWRQNVTKMANLEAQMKLLRGSRVTFLDRGRDLMKKRQTQKTNDSRAIWKDFGMLEGLVGPSRSHCLLILMLSWAMLGHLGIILRQHSDKMRQSWDQDEVQDRQDVPTWSARGPLEGRRHGGGAIRHLQQDALRRCVNRSFQPGHEFAVLDLPIAINICDTYNLIDG